VYSSGEENWRYLSSRLAMAGDASRVFPYEAGVALVCVATMLSIVVLVWSAYRCIRCYIKSREYEPIP